MKKSLSEQGITLRLKGGRIRHENPQGMAKLGKTVVRVVAKSRKMGGNVSHSGATGSKFGGPASFRASPQRVAVRFSYSKATAAGLWQAHGKYLERESAQQRATETREPGQGEGSGPALGFGSGGEQVAISETMDAWEKAGDTHMWRVIISPEFGEKMDLQRLTKKAMARIEGDLGTADKPRRLEWIAVEHVNTDNPHVHVVIRGVDAEGQSLTIAKDYIKKGAREGIQEVATRQIGFCTEKDHIAALERQVTQQRFTDIDRALLFARKPDGLVTVQPRSAIEPHLRDAMVRRLSRLREMGLAQQKATFQWDLDPSLEQSLRAMQVGSDLIKTKALHRTRITDPALPLVKDKLSEVGEHIGGRVVGTGLDDNTNRPYMLIEGVDGRVHYIDQTVKIQTLRGKGDFAAGDFVSLDVVEGKARPIVQVEIYGRKITTAHVDDELIRAGQLGAAQPAHTIGGQFQAVAAERLDRLQKSGAIEMSPAGRISLRSTAALDRVEYADRGMTAENYTDTGIAGRIEAKGRDSIAVNDGSGSVKVLTTAQLKETGFDMPYAVEGAYLVIAESSPGKLKATQIRAEMLDKMVVGGKLNALDKLHSEKFTETHPLYGAVARRGAVWNERGIDPRDNNFRIKANTWSRAMETNAAIAVRGVNGAVADLSKQIGKPVMDLGLSPGARVSGRVVFVHNESAAGSSTVVIDRGRDLCRMTIPAEHKAAVGQRLQVDTVTKVIDKQRVTAWRVADLERQALKGKARDRSF